MADVWSPLITNWAVNKVDSDPRRGTPDTIQDHHAASTSEAVCLSLFAPGGRTVTPNVFIAGKRIWGIVPENRRAYTSGSSIDDHRSLTIEHLNLTGASDWRIAVDTIISSVALHVDWATRYGIPVRHGSPGILEHRNIYEWYRRSYPTACAGPGWDMAGFIRQVAAAMTPKPKPAPEPEPTIGDLMAFKSVGIGYRPNEKEDRLVSVGLDFEHGQRVETVASKAYCESWYRALTGGGLVITTEGHYKNMLAEFDGLVQTKREYELEIARASADSKTA